VEIAKNEKDIKVRRQAIQKLGNERNAAAGDALVSIYSSETDQDVKRSIIDALSNQHNAKAMVAAAKAEKDSRMQQRIVERLAGMKNPEATEYLMELLRK
jgi:HEAT repeat protein